MSTAVEFAAKFDLLRPFLNERTRRLMAAAEVLGRPHGWLSRISRATGLSRRVVAAGVEELRSGVSLAVDRIRQHGGGRKKLTELAPSLKTDLQGLIDPETRGDPESPLRWTSKSVRHLTEELRVKGHRIGRQAVSELLHELGYSLQGNAKVLEGADEPDRDEQFHYINRQVSDRLRRQQPVISVDTKKKENVGNFKNNGRELRPKGDPEKVKSHDFAIPELGRVAPYGVYDVAKNVGWVSVGVDHDTATFAVETISKWWRTMGRVAYPKATSLLIMADCGGSNGYRVRLWKTELQRFADDTGLRIDVRHFPPGTSKWNKIEHRMFSFISQNWRGKPLVSHEVIVQLIAATTTTTGLKIDCELDTAKYPKGTKVPDDELAQIRIKRHHFRGDWNYSISPRNSKSP